MYLPLSPHGFESLYGIKVNDMNRIAASVERRLATLACEPPAAEARDEARVLALALQGAPCIMHARSGGSA